jgi:hypothetical protein
MTALLLLLLELRRLQLLPLVPSLLLPWVLKTGCCDGSLLHIA